MAVQYGSPYPGSKQMGMPPGIDDEFLNEPDPAPPMPTHYNGWDNGPSNRYEARVPLPGLGPSRSPYSQGSSPVPIDNDVSPPGLDIDGYGGGGGFEANASFGGGSLQRWDGNLSMSSYGGNQRASSPAPAPTRNDVMWEENTVTLRRQAKFGFGLAVSGGKDNPHYQSGETSIVVSDVLAQGPAAGKLKINDRLLIVNGQSMENVYHKMAVDALRQAGNTVTITFKRKKVTQSTPSYNYTQVEAAPVRTPAGSTTSQSLPRNIHSTQSAPPKLASGTMDTRSTMYLRKKRTEGYGMQLGWVLFVQGLGDNSVASREGVLKGDTINKINNVPVETLSYADARKLIQNSKEKLQLEISRNRDNSLGIPTPLSQSRSSFETPTTGKQQPDPMQGLFVPQPMPDEDDDDPIVAMQASTNMSAPPRPPLPSGNLDFGAGDSRMPPRPPSPGQQVGSMGIPEEPEDPERHIAFYKGTSVGLRLIGGNEVGIYVTAVQPNSPAEQSGVRVGDRIVQVNDTSLLGKTKEDVVMMLLGIIDEVRLIVRYSELAHRRVKETGKGDKFFVRAHFDYKAPSKEEMSFKKGSTFRILDTMPDGVMGHWYAIRLDRTNQPAERGIIPNNNRADELHLSQQSDDQPNPSTKDGRAGFFQRRGLRSSTLRRTKSKDHWDEIVFGGQPAKFPAYERVLLRESGFIRPVVIFGPIADLVRDQLLQDEPDTYETPLMERKVNDNPGEPMRVSSQGTIKVHAIRDIMDKGKHCLLDITPNAVEQLNYAQCYPIVIFLNADSRSVVKEIRGQFLEPSFNKGSRKYYQTAKKLKKFYLHTFTAMIPINADGQWYHQLKEAVQIQQNRDIWMSEVKSNEPIPDINLPTIGHLTLPSDYESDAESVFTVDSRGDASFLTSEAESDFDMDKSPSNPDKEKDSYSFRSPESPVEKEGQELPESAPPPDKYSSDEGDIGDDEDDRSRKKRKARPKRIDDRVRHNMSRDERDRNYGRPRSRSRSRSRDRRSEVADIEDEDAEKSLNVESRMKYAEKLESSWTAPARPSRKDMLKKRQEMKRSASQSRVDDEEAKVNGHMENGPVESDGMIQASVQLNVESAPPPKVDPYKYMRSTNMPKDVNSRPSAPEKRPTPSGIQLGYNTQERQNERPQQRPPSPPLSDDGFPDMPLPGMQQPGMQQRAPPAPAKKPGIYKPTPFADVIIPNKAKTVESAPPPTSFRPYESVNPPHADVRETTFGLDDDDEDLPPFGLPTGMPTGMPTGLPTGLPSGLPSNPPPVSVQASIHMNGSMPKETTFDADIDDDEPLVAWSFPSEEVPDRQPPSPPIPADIPNRRPPPPPLSSKPEIVAKPPEPVYAKVQKEPIRVSPPTWRSESPRNTQPTRTESPYSRVDDFPAPPKMEEPAIVSVKSSVVESAPPPSLPPKPEEDDDYKNQLRAVSSRPSKPRSESPYGWNPGGTRESRTRAREKWFTDGQPEQAPPKETTFGAPHNDKINNNNNGHTQHRPDVPNIEPHRHKVNQNPYDRQSYKAYRDQREQAKHRSKSPGRMYQESSIYAPKGWKARSSSPFQPIPVSEEALNANEGHEIVAMARGVFDHNGGCLSSVETGVSIVIPKGAIPEGIKQEVYFKVCKDTNNLPPLDRDKGETLLSPLVMCGPHGLKWLQPVELRLPHRASKTPDGWSFNLKSSDSTTEGDTSSWRNMVIPGMEDSQCQVNANSVSVLVDHF